jgi:DNA-binding response OmpR family regulator
MAHDTDATILIVESNQEQAMEYARWLDDYTVRIAVDGATALNALNGDIDVDVVLLDSDLPDHSSADLIGRIRAHQRDCQIGLFSRVSASTDTLQLDIDEYVPRPINREDLRETVARLINHGAVESAVETYLSLVAQRRRMERRRDGEELAADERYRELTSEITARRRQIDTLLAQIDDPITHPDSDATTAPEDARTENQSGVNAGKGPPLYRTRATEFYALWFVAALTYGVGDVVSTLYATLTIPGLIEGNLVVNALLSAAGLPGFILLKLLVLFVLISISVQGGQSREQFSYYWPPLVATGIGLLLTGWNVRLILGA